ncbi:MAG: DUF1499 domain-containing protein [Salinarimonadaceae bacterium]|nr:MAG: DUF1499 domain-containing protein [Salinarimonadaceae bacterium]
MQIVSPLQETKIMRRINLEEPVTRFATWSGRTGWMALAVTGIAALLVRADRIEAEAGLAAIVAGIGFAGIAVALALAAFVRIWSEGRRGLGRAFAGLALGLIVLGPPTFLAASRQIEPQPLDVATDATRALSFSTSPATVEARGGWTGPPAPPSEGGPGAAPLLLDLSFRNVVAIAQRAASARGLSVIERPEIVRSDEEMTARLEARGRTLVLRLPVELTVRITSVGERTRIDARAAAPLGNHDLGGNVDVLRAYLEEIEFLASLQ